MTDTLAHRRELCFWGWGYTADQLNPEEASHADSLVSLLSPGGVHSHEDHIRAMVDSLPDGVGPRRAA